MGHCASLACVFWLEEPHKTSPDPQDIYRTGHTHLICSLGLKKKKKKGSQTRMQKLSFSMSTVFDESRFVVYHSDTVCDPWGACVLLLVALVIVQFSCHGND